MRARNVLLCLVVVANLWPAASAWAAQPGLVAAYGFEEGSGATASDRSGNDNTGNLSGGGLGGATWTTQGKFGNALSLDGTDGMVTVPDSPSLDLTTGMTLSAWVRPTAVGGWRTVALKEQPNQLVYALYSDSDVAPTIVP